MTIYFCDLPNPATCSFEEWAMQVRDLLCMHGYTWDNLRVVDCGTLPSTFTALFGSASERLNAIVIEKCSPDPNLYLWNGISWEKLLINIGASPVTTILYAHTNAVVFPYSFGTGQLVGYQNKPVENLTYGAYSTITKLWTCALAGWYRIQASYTLRLKMTGVGRIGGNPLCYNSFQLYRSSTVFDHRTLISDDLPAQVVWQDNGPIPDTSPQTFDIKLPQDALPNTGNIAWQSVRLLASAFNYLKAGDVVAARVGSSFLDMNGTREWGIGGAASPLRYERMTIERIDT